MEGKGREGSGMSVSSQFILCCGDTGFKGGKGWERGGKGSGGEGSCYTPKVKP
jgi:hypothetical protein